MSYTSPVIVFTLKIEPLTEELSVQSPCFRKAQPAEGALQAVELSGFASCLWIQLNDRRSHAGAKIMKYSKDGRRHAKLHFSFYLCRGRLT